MTQNREYLEVFNSYSERRLLVVLDLMAVNVFCQALDKHHYSIFKVMDPIMTNELLKALLSVLKAQHNISLSLKVCSKSLVFGKASPINIFLSACTMPTNF